MTNLPGNMTNRFCLLTNFRGLALLMPKRWKGDGKGTFEFFQIVFLAMDEHGRALTEREIE
jgi:hypothetical protein